MSAVNRVTLLLLAVLGANAAVGPENCDGLNTTLPAKDMLKINGEWVLVWSVADNEQTSHLLKNLSSSHVKLQLLPDNKTLMFNERNLFLDKSCTKYFLSMPMPSSNSTDSTLSSITGTFEKDNVTVQYNDSGTVELFESCSDCLVMVYKANAGQYLLTYKRMGHHQDVEALKADHANHEKLAQCLGFPHDHPFIYDGAAEFCPEAPPAATAAPLEA